MAVCVCVCVCQTWLANSSVRGNNNPRKLTLQPGCAGIAEEAAALASVQQQRREAKRSAAAAAVLVSGKQQSHRPARASMRPQGGGPGGTTGDSKKSRGKYGKLWNKRHDMKVIAKPAKKKPGKAKAVDLF